MTLREDVAADLRPRGPECGVPKLLRSLEEPFRGEVAEAIADETLQAKALGRVLRAKDLGLSGFTIGRHRRGECSCR